ncbi:hypothetical protein ACFQVC_24580 [Streptomyces monticola]|uniref:Uncharacterized protein n=1 Tax=Streptomyces monticola TaxID=2666263 RepID=A0ABW2JPW2_9ACTN
MHNGFPMRRIGSAAVAGAAALAVLAPAASAVDHAPVRQQTAAAQEHVSAQEGAKKRLTVKGYVGYLEAKGTPAAKATLRSFRKLSPAQQTKFVGYLQSREVYSAFLGALKGSTSTPHLRKPVAYNSDVRFVRDARITKKSSSSRTNTRITYTMTEQIYGIAVTSEQLWVSYQTKSGKVTKVLGAGASVSNVNAALAIRHGKVERRKQGPGVFAETTVHASPRYPGFGSRIVKEQRVDAGWKGTWKAVLRNA